MHKADALNCLKPKICCNFLNYILFQRLDNGCLRAYYLNMKYPIYILIHRECYFYRGGVLCQEISHYKRPVIYYLRRGKAFPADCLFGGVIYKGGDILHKPRVSVQVAGVNRNLRKRGI